MDVVKRGVEALRGQVTVASEPGRGTTFKLRLPLTMAISDAMLVRVGQERYLVPTISIEESFRPAAGSVMTVGGRGEMVQLRGRLLPMLRLHRLFGVSGAVTEPHEGLLIVLEGHSRRCALLVDELLGQQQVVIKTLGSAFANTAGVAGGAILGDGRVGLILDASGLVDMTESNTGGQAAA
jgi:two-component system chemotaxis sensor kinase CheA